MKVHVDNGRTLEGRPLGKGLFSRAYMVERQVYIVNVKEDYSKECIALFCQAECIHIPKIKYLGYNCKDQQVFIMPYYDKLKASHKEAWNQGKKLRGYIDLAYSETRQRKNHEFSEWIQENLESLNVPASLKEAIRTIVNAAMNYGEDARLEANPANLGVDKKGNLVLRDILCFKSSIEKALKRLKSF